MAITRIKNSSINNRTPKYNDVLAGLPFRPIIGTASDGGNGTSASVAFTPNNFANGTITYTALSSPGSFTGTGTASPITVSGLTSGTAYTFQVKAGNSLGDSAYSAASNSVTPVTPTAFESIATATGTGSSATITFSSIPSTYQHLQIRFMTKPVANGGAVLMTLNGISTSTYWYHYLAGNGTSAFAGSSGAANTSIFVMDNLSTPVTNIFGVGIIDIHDYVSTTKVKTIRCFSGTDDNTTTNGNEIQLWSGKNGATTAISSISFQNTSGQNFASGTTFALYGVKGA